MNIDGTYQKPSVCLNLKAQIIAAIEKVCDVAGGLANTCKQLVEAYGPQIIYELINKAVN